MSKALVQILDVEASVVPSLIATGAISPRDAAAQLERMNLEHAATVLAEMPVLMAAAVCRSNIGCGDEISLLPCLPSDRAAEVMLTDLVMFRTFGGELDAFRRLVVEGVPLEELATEEDARTVEIVNVHGRRVRIPLAIDAERAKAYIATLIAMDDEDAQDETIRAVGEDTIVSLCAMVMLAMSEDDLEEDDEWRDCVHDFSPLYYSAAVHLSTSMTRLTIEQELLEPHVAAMERNFAPVQALFAEHEGESAEDLIAKLK